LEVRGEGFLTVEGCKRLDDQLAGAGKPLFANPRNSAAGSLRQKGPRVSAQRDLRMLTHGFGVWRGPGEPRSQSEIYERFREFGLPVSGLYRVVDGPDGVWEYITYYGEHRHDPEYE